MMMVMPATPVLAHDSGRQKGETVAEALLMHAKDISGARPVKRCVNEQAPVRDTSNRKPCRSGI
ncbi:hypothetical protein GW15_0214005 [Xanthomonas axonopodis pv. vasculorum]|uniref:Uncharacterized protein n=1 Tax=Xanthomonas axonopodis pv. vasculorum TaxID=325777 RepID=A0A098PWK5_9XANT|nr:hypothetical protein GW15_0214005 [Xanthomonas axonopodis pv. vasculorum]